MKRRLVILSVVVAIFAGIVWAFPDSPGMKPSRLAKNLPEVLGNWIGKPEEAGEAEKSKLASDTEFERMSYYDKDGVQPPVQASIVFSGKNLSQSIHRPEVCLRAQGWDFMSETSLNWKDILANGEVLPVRKILCRRLYQTVKEEGGKPEDVLLPNGEKAYIWQIFYYTFVGHEKIVSGHYERTGEDMKDRLLKGYDQRWAYATFSSLITKKLTDQGIRYGQGASLNEKETEEHVQAFLRRLLPLVISEPGEGLDATLDKRRNLGS